MQYTIIVVEVLQASRLSVTIDMKALYDKIHQAVTHYLPEVEIPEGIAVAAIQDVLDQVLFEHPEIFWCSSTFDYHEDRHVVVFHYLFSKEETEEMSRKKGFPLLRLLPKRLFGFMKRRASLEEAEDWEAADVTTYEPYFPLSDEPETEKGASHSTIRQLFNGETTRAHSTDRIFASVFSPAEVKVQSLLNIEIYLHLLEEARWIVSLAKPVNSKAVRNGYLPFTCMLTQGDKVTVRFQIGNDEVSHSAQYLINWEGMYTQCCFQYLVPDTLNCNKLKCEVAFEVNDRLIGRMKFCVKVVESPRFYYPEISTIHCEEEQSLRIEG